MVCLTQSGLKLAANLNFKEESTKIVASFFVIAFLHYFLNSYVFNVFADLMLWKSKPKLKRRGAKASEEDIAQFEKLKHKFVTSAWKLVSYGFFVGYGLYSLKDQTHWVFSPSDYPACFPDNIIPSALKLYYSMAISYYLYACISIAFEPKMKDRREMMVHHAVTLSLLFMSYTSNMVKYGLAILILHDLADPWMELAKICFYSQVQWLSNIFFFIFASVFIYLRVYIFPRFIIWPIFMHERGKEYEFYWPTVICLGTLWVLHVFWSYLIMRVLTESVLGNGKKGDVREED